jgi:hypothetical protein
MVGLCVATVIALAFALAFFFMIYWRRRAANDLAAFRQQQR